MRTVLNSGRSMRGRLQESRIQICKQICGLSQTFYVYSLPFTSQLENPLTTQGGYQSSVCPQLKSSMTHLNDPSCLPLVERRGHRRRQIKSICAKLRRTRQQLYDVATPR